MKKLLITLLLLTTFCSGTAFAWDKYSTTVASQDAALSSIEADIIHDHASGTHADDHCAHGAAHLVGIFYNASLPVISAIPNHQNANLVPLASLYISPLLRPPIV